MNLHAPMLASEDQYITWYVDNGIGTNGGYISTVHAKITTTERRELWDSLTSLNAHVDGPWFYKGDFIIILEPGEKRGGIPNRAYKSFDFVTCMNDCGVKDAGFVGSNFTWCNNRRPRRRLSTWSKEEIGEINQKVEEWEAIVQGLEDQDLNVNKEESRAELNKVQAESVKWMTLREALLKEKSQITWFEDGDSNSRYFHNVVKDRRRKLQIHRIKNYRGRWILGDEKIYKATVKYFEKLFNQPTLVVDRNLIDCIPNCKTKDDNVYLSQHPDEEEIKEAVFDMIVTSSAGLDGFNGMLYQKCWDIIKDDTVIFSAGKSKVIKLIIKQPNKELIEADTLFWDEKGVVFQFGNIGMTPLLEEIGGFTKLPWNSPGLLVPENSTPHAFLKMIGSKKNEELGFLKKSYIPFEFL
ncbi:uncharacterized protein [Nicotiana tomentosiformis]|uniref:uncharacterized protein n=1 Tax=Nicotiana tomentosiformis TaxID=4098 RepID=UPI00388C98F2